MRANPTPSSSPWPVRPVTRARLKDFQALFMGRGCPSYCWCAPYRFADSHRIGKAEKKQRMAGLVLGGIPVGVLAYEGKEPIGWCSIAPGETYAKLATSKVMPRVGQAPTWTILCFFVRRDHRDRGVPHALVEGAVAYAMKKGARVVEAYPWDTSGLSSTNLGHSSVYRRAGFVHDHGRRWIRQA